MAIPQQVKQRSEDVDKFFQQNQAQPAQQPEAGDSEGAQRDQEERAREEQAAAEQQEAEQGQQGEEPGAVPQSQVQEIGEQGQSDSGQEQPDMSKRVEKMDQQLRTLQGMMRSTSEENQQLRAIISQMNEQPQQTPQQESQPAKPSADDSKDNELFGEDFVEMVERRIANRLKGLEDRLAQAEGTAKQSQRVSADVQQERFQNRLAERVPKWQEIDSDPDFRDWVSQSNTRVAFIQQAMADYDADAIADIFEQYKALSGTGQEKKPAPAKRNLEEKVSPSKGRTSTSSGQPEEKKIWPRSEIAQVFANRRNYDPKEFDELQREIFAAQKEGRVDPSK